MRPVTMDSPVTKWAGLQLLLIEWALIKSGAITAGARRHDRPRLRGRFLTVLSHGGQWRSSGAARFGRCDRFFECTQRVGSITVMRYRLNASNG